LNLDSDFGCQLQIFESEDKTVQKFTVHLDHMTINGTKLARASLELEFPDSYVETAAFSALPPCINHG